MIGCLLYNFERLVHNLGEVLPEDCGFCVILYPTGRDAQQKLLEDYKKSPKLMLIPFVETSLAQVIGGTHHEREPMRVTNVDGRLVVQCGELRAVKRNDHFALLAKEEEELAAEFSKFCK